MVKLFNKSKYEYEYIEQDSYKLNLELRSIPHSLYKLLVSPGEYIRRTQIYIHKAIWGKVERGSLIVKFFYSVYPKERVNHSLFYFKMEHLDSKWIGSG